MLNNGSREMHARLSSPDAHGKSILIIGGSEQDPFAFAPGDHPGYHYLQGTDWAKSPAAHTPSGIRLVVGLSEVSSMEGQFAVEKRLSNPRCFWQQKAMDVGAALAGCIGVRTSGKFMLIMVSSSPEGPLSLSALEATKLPSVKKSHPKKKSPDPPPAEEHRRSPTGEMTKAIFDAGFHDCIGDWARAALVLLHERHGSDVGSFNSIKATIVKLNRKGKLPTAPAAAPAT